MSMVLEHDYIGLSETNPSSSSSMEKGSLNLIATELRLGLPGRDSPERDALKSGAKRGFSHGSELHSHLLSPSHKPSPQPVHDQMAVKPQPCASKAQVVGWPPIRSSRKNLMAQQHLKSGEDACLYVKVSMDGAPYLRKVDLNIYGSYTELSSALEKMFSCFTIGQCDSNGISSKDGLSTSRLMDLLHGSEFVLTYEDKDGDWMLVGDVPWDMFTESCKRLRIMKSSDAIGLAPRAMEKCKTRK